MNYIFRLDSQEKSVLGLVHEFISKLVKNWLSYELKTICPYLGIRFCPNSIKLQYFLMRLTLCERYNAVFVEYSGY